MEDEAQEAIDHLREEIEEKTTEEKKGNALITRIALTTAIIAALAALTSYQAGEKADDAMICQIKASDHWGQYQAKSIKLSILDVKTVPDIEKEKERYKEELKEIGKDAKAEEEESRKNIKEKKDLALGIALFQISIALSAIGAITRKEILWYISMGTGTLGLIQLMRVLL
jgi:Domain of unknown function (DUF4337)